MNHETSCDSSTLINFLRIKRMDLLKKSSLNFLISDHVCQEVHSLYFDQYAELNYSLGQGIISKKDVNTIEEWQVFADLAKTHQLGAGECAAIAIAACNGYKLAIDDNQAIKKASKLIPGSDILRTSDLIKLFIQEQILSIDEADEIVHIWETKHRFKMASTDYRTVVSQVVS